MKYTILFLGFLFTSCTSKSASEINKHINNVYDSIEAVVIKINESDSLREKYKNTLNKCDSIYKNITTNADSIIVNSKIVFNEIKENNKNILNKIKNLND